MEYSVTFEIRSMSHSKRENEELSLSEAEGCKCIFITTVFSHDAKRNKKEEEICCNKSFHKKTINLHFYLTVCICRLISVSVDTHTKA